MLRAEIVAGKGGFLVLHLNGIGGGIQPGIDIISDEELAGICAVGHRRLGIQLCLCVRQFSFIFRLPCFFGGFFTRQFRLFVKIGFRRDLRIQIGDVCFCLRNALIQLFDRLCRRVCLRHGGHGLLGCFINLHGLIHFHPCGIVRCVSGIRRCLCRLFLILRNILKTSLPDGGHKIRRRRFLGQILGIQIVIGQTEAVDGTDADIGLIHRR